MIGIKWYDYRLLEKWKLIGTATGVAPWEAKFVLECVANTPGHVVEIGTHRGDLAREIATAYPLREIHCVDKADPSYGVKAEDIGEVAKPFSNVAIHLMDSKDFTIPKGTGVVFIDGDHTWDGVKIDTENALRHFRTHRGMILWHDYNEDNEVMPYLDWLVHRTRLDIVHLNCTSIAYLVI